MQALFVILNDTYLINDIHEILLKCGVGATTFNSSGLGDVRMDYEDRDNPFTSLRKVMQGDKPDNQTIISVIKDDDKLDKVTTEILKVMGNIEEKGVGFMFTVPVNVIFGHRGKTSL